MSPDVYDGYDDVVRSLYRSLERRTRSMAGAEMGSAAEEAFEPVEERLLAAATSGHDARSDFERAHAAENWFTLGALDSMIGVTHAVHLAVSTGDLFKGSRPPSPIPYVTSALATRALSVAHEIGALLRAGFPIGGRSRWRTLYEIDVVASVLALGNRGTAARFVNHRWVQLALDREREDNPERWESNDGPEPDVMRRRFVAIWQHIRGHLWLGRRTVSKKAQGQESCIS